MAWPPTASPLVVSLAVVPERGIVPITVAPSRNSTLPLRPLGAVTVAVSVRFWPTVEELSDDVTAVEDEVAEVFTVSGALAVLVVKLPSPAYVAEIVWLPDDNPF